MNTSNTIIRTNKRENPYVMIDKYGLNDERLSWKAKGLLAYLLSKPDDWQVYERDLIKRATDGRDAVRSTLRELESFGYLSRRQIRGENGSFGHMEYIVYERPFEEENTVNGKSVHGENPLTENPSTGFPSTGNPTHTNKELNNNDLNNKTEEEEEDMRVRADVSDVPSSEIENRFKTLIQKNKISPKIAEKILEAIGDINSYEIEALEMTFKKAMTRIKRGTIGTIPKWFAGTLLNDNETIKIQNIERDERLAMERRLGMHSDER